MRPDEHKQKKSAQYQRKHGGSSAAKGGKTESENDKNPLKAGKQQGSSRNEANERNRTSQTDQKTTSRTKFSDSSSGSEEEGEGKDIRIKSFRRREIASNWAKYDLPTGDDGDELATTPKGQDFNKLLQSADGQRVCSGSAMAHFRFKDEESWEDDGCAASGPGAQVLSLDCAELATSLSCLPLHCQLGLKTDIFTTDQLTTMKKTADENRQAAGLPAPTPDIDDASQKPPPSKPASSLPASTPGNLSRNHTDNVPSPSPVVMNKGEKDSVSKRNKDEKEKTGTKADVTTSRNDPSGSAGYTDADLDSLLAGEDDFKDSPDPKGHTARSASTEVKARLSEQPTSSVKASSGGEEVTEQDLDDLLAMDTPQPSQSAAVKDSGSKTNDSKMAAESAELEDWLDSVLDD